MGTGVQIMEDFKITASDSAIDKIKEILTDEPNEETKLRVFVQGGGCSGLSYNFMLDTDLTMEDFVCDLGSGVQVIVDSMSAQYLNGAQISFKRDLMSESFTINNPNAESSCGCGNSFSPF